MNRPRILDDADKEKILVRVRRGEYLLQIARGTGFNTTIIRATAQRAGLVIQRCSEAVAVASMKRGRETQAQAKAQPKVVMTATPTLEQYWRGQTCNARWGAKW